MKIVPDQPTTESIASLTWAIQDHLQTGELPQDQVRTLNRLVERAIGYVEHRLRRQLLTATFKAYLSGWSDRIKIDDKLPITSIDGIQYYDTDGDMQTLAADRYVTDIISANYPAVIVPVTDVVLPELKADRANPIVISFTAGYGGAEDIPPTIRHAITMLVADWYEVRENVITGTIVARVPFGVEAMLSAEDWGAYA